MKSFREESPTHQIALTGLISKRIFQQKLRTEGVLLTPEQVGVLNLLIEKDGVSMQELSAKFSRDNSATTRLIDNLESKKLIKRKNSKSDRRVKKIIITEKGKHEISLANIVGRNYVDLVVNGISKSDLEIFFKVIKNIRQNMLNIEEKTFSAKR
jgi:DNA-binding MarR family transcriptional regulator